jgi:hypothetical protein
MQWLLSKSSEHRPVAYASVHRLRQAMDAWTETLKNDWGEVRSSLRNACDGHSTAEDEHTRARFIAGLAAGVIAPWLFFLNLLVLAQVMELFVPEGTDPWSVPGIGPIQPLALLLAAIFAVCESLVAIAAKEAVTSWPVRVLAGMVFVMAVAFECYGAWLRGQVMGGFDGGAESGPLSGHTAAVSCLIGFVAPVSEAVASILFFSGVLHPLGFTGLRLPRMLHHWSFLKLYRWRYGTLLDSIWKPFEIVAAEEATDRYVHDLRTVHQQAEALACGASRFRHLFPMIQQHAEGAARVRSGFLGAIRQARSGEALVAPLPPLPTVAMTPPGLRDYENRCERRARDLDHQVREVAQKAHTMVSDQLHQIAARMVESDQGILDQIRAGSTVLPELRQRCERLKAARDTVLTTLAHVLSGEQFQLHDVPSQEASLLSASEILIRLDGQSPQGVDPKLMGREARREQLCQAIGERLMALPEGSPLKNVLAAVEAAEQEGEAARALLAEANEVDLILTPGQFQERTTEIDQEHIRLQDQIRDLQEDLQARAVEARKLYRIQTSPLAKLSRWLHRGGTWVRNVLAGGLDRLQGEIRQGTDREGPVPDPSPVPHCKLAPREGSYAFVEMEEN